jgi:glycerol-3-phosphate acyltransferase PlsY
VPPPLIALSLGYAVGSIPFGLLAARAAHVDLRRTGSGNPGAANALRAGGVPLAAFVLLLDVLKGAAGVRWVARLTTGAAAVVGHIYPVWLGFRGGKGVATAAGAFGVLTPMAIAPAAALFVATVWITRYISLGSIVATVALAPLTWAAGAPAAVSAAASAVGALVVFRHRSNISRLRRGVERRIGQRVSA